MALEGTDDALIRVMTTIEELKHSMEEQIKALKEELKKSHEEVLENVMSKVKRSQQLEFKRKGNFTFNDAVAEKLEEAKTELESVQKEGMTDEMCSR